MSPISQSAFSFSLLRSVSCTVFSSVFTSLVCSSLQMFSILINFQRALGSDSKESPQFQTESQGQVQSLCSPPLSFLVPWRTAPSEYIFWNGRRLQPSIQNLSSPIEDGFLDCVYFREESGQHRWRRIQLPAESPKSIDKNAPLIALSENKNSWEITLNATEIRQFQQESFQLSQSDDSSAALPACQLRIRFRSFHIPCKLNSKGTSITLTLTAETQLNVRQVLGRDPSFDDPFVPQSATVYFYFPNFTLHGSTPVRIVLPNQSPEILYFAIADGKCKLLLWDADENHLSAELTLDSDVKSPLKKKVSQTFSSRTSATNQFLEGAIETLPTQKCRASVSDGTHIFFASTRNEVLTWDEALKLAIKKSHSLQEKSINAEIFSEQIAAGIWQDWKPQRVDLKYYQQNLKKHLIDCLGSKADCRILSRKRGDQPPVFMTHNPDSNPVVGVSFSSPFFQIQYFEVLLH